MRLDSKARPRREMMADRSRPVGESSSQDRNYALWSASPSRQHGPFPSPPRPLTADSTNSSAEKGPPLAAD